MRNVSLLAVLCVLFLSVSFPVTKVIGKPTEKMEWYTAFSPNATGDTAVANFWLGQSFTVGTVGPDLDFKVSYVKLFIFRIGNPGKVTVSIRASDENGYPTGSDLCSGSVDGNKVTDNPDLGIYYKIDFPARPMLSAGTQYTIVLKAVNGSEGNVIIWVGDFSDGATYPGGWYSESVDSGSTWNNYGYNGDLVFEVYGAAQSPR